MRPITTCSIHAKLASGAGLLIIESTGVPPNGRLFHNDIGIFTDAHTAFLKPVVDAVHAKDTPVFIQLTHGGRKSWRKRRIAAACSKCHRLR
ncbi:hypothetical protein VQ056_31815 [Paenibacillus sp. JTLBN-2024]